MFEVIQNPELEFYGLSVTTDFYSWLSAAFLLLIA